MIIVACSKLLSSFNRKVLFVNLQDYVSFVKLIFSLSLPLNLLLSLIVLSQFFKKTFYMFLLFVKIFSILVSFNFFAQDKKTNITSLHCNNVGESLSSLCCSPSGLTVGLSILSKNIECCDNYRQS